MERLAGTLQSDLSELTQILTEQEASATAKQEELKVDLQLHTHTHVCCGTSIEGYS